MAKHYFINAPKRRRPRRKATVRRMKSGRKRSARAAISHRNPSGGAMATRRRRRKSAAPVRRRRRRSHVRRHARRRRNPGAIGPVRRRNPRRRRRAVARHRRRRRNPGIASARGIVQGLKDGAAVVGGQVATRKISGAVTGMLPATMQPKVQTGVGKIGLSLLSAVVTSLIARRALPAQSRLITAGAFSETINCALAQTPIAPFLSAYPHARRLSAYPTSGYNVPAGMSAYPGTGTRRVLTAGAPRVPQMRVVGVTGHG